MAVSPAVAALSFVATIVLLTGLWAWVIAAARMAISRQWVGDSTAAWMAGVLQSLGIPPQLPLVAWTQRRPVPWTTIDLLMVIGLYVLGSAAAVLVAEEMGTFVVTVGRFVIGVAQDQVLIVASMLASLAILAVGLPLIGFRTEATPTDFGWSLRDLGQDFKLGVVAFLMLAPPVYAMQGVLVSFWQESKHPLVEMFKEEPSGGFFAILFVSAAIAAPLFEEMVFRVLLQGFLEKVFAPARAPTQPETIPQLEATLSPPDEHGEGNWPSSPPDNNPYASPNEDSRDPAPAKLADEAEPALQPSWLPVVISSVIFAALHYSHGPDWVPLFFLAMGLGYLYQRTHRLMPSLVVHSLLNAISMWGLWVTVHQATPS